jgi:transposase-like protein
MAGGRLPLAEPLRKAGGGDFPRAVAEAVLQPLVEADAEGPIGAGRHERSPERLGWRGGYRDRTLGARPGSLQPRVPKLRQGSHSPPFPEPRKVSEEASAAVIREARTGGVPTRRVDELVRAVGPGGVSRSAASELCKDTDGRVGAFLERPLGGERPYPWLDATRLKVREGGRIVPAAATIAVAVGTAGRRETVGLGPGPSGAGPFWSTFPRGVPERGLGGVRLVVSDAREGLRHAAAKVLGATWRRCRVHRMRDASAHVPEGRRTVAAAALRQAFLQADRAGARRVRRRVADRLRPRWPRLAALADESEADVLACMASPARHRAKLHSTDPSGRLSKEVKRRADVVGIFPCEASITRLTGAVPPEQNDERQLQHRHMRPGGMAGLLAPEPEAGTLSLPPRAARATAASDPPGFALRRRTRPVAPRSRRRPRSRSGTAAGAPAPSCRSGY